MGSIAALAGSAALLVSADSPGQMVGLGIVFLVAAGLEATAYIAGIRPWLKGRPVPRQVEVAQVVLVLLALLAFAGGAVFGGVVLCGFIAGALVPNVGAIRYARLNREMAVRGELQLAEARTSWQQGGQAGEPTVDPVSEPTDPDADAEWASSRPAPHVGRVLRAELVEERQQWLAWAAAAAVAMLGCAAAGENDVALYGVGFVAAGALVWVGSQYVGLWRALQDYQKAKSEPRRAYVALVNDPNVRVKRPLLGVWSSEPIPQGRLPRAEQVYRCDEERLALMSPPGRVIVHEAWVDTGRRSGSRPQWVVADAGLALPHRSAVLGRWYLASLIGSERPAGARPLTVRAPDPNAEPHVVNSGTLVSEQPPVFGGWARLFAWRLAALLAIALFFVWTT